CLRDVQRHLAEQAGAFALEERMLLGAHDDVQVARRPAGRARLALARDAELAARVDPGGDLDLEPALDGHLALAAALLARARDHAAGAVAAAAAPGHAEEALLESHLARAVAGAAGRGLGARGAAAAGAGRAGLGPRDLHVGLGAEHGLLEGQLEVVAQ